MIGLSAKELLSLWERGRGQGPLARGLLLLTHARPDLDREAREGLPLGERDRLLTALRVATFGHRAPLLAVCPHCDAEVETDLDLTSLPSAPRDAEAPASVARFEHRGREHRFRRPTSADLRAALAAGPAAETVVAERCLDVAPDRELLVAFGEALSASDPWAEIALELICPDCEGRWGLVFDIVSYLWREIEARAQRLLREVHTLARAYGWSEREILELSPLRRQLYLGLVHS